MAVSTGIIGCMGLAGVLLPSVVRRPRAAEGMGLGCQLATVAAMATAQAAVGLLLTVFVMATFVQLPSPIKSLG